METMTAGDIEEEGQGPLYADAESKLEGADIVIAGAPFERTTCHRKGCAEGPWAIRHESYNFETYIPEFDFDIESLSICDCGDIGGTDFPWFFREAWAKAWEVRLSGAFPILLGGEHSVTPMWLACLMGVDPWDLGDASPSGPNTWTDDFCVVTVDAHLDFRDGYLGEHLSHASAIRRVSELVDVDSVIPFGVRSYCSEERRDADAQGLHFVTADGVRERGVRKCLAEALERVPSGKRDKVYLSLDIDGVDPAYAPGVGTPEPFGLTPLELRELIMTLDEKLVGFDAVEVCPPSDNGNTAALAARLTSSVMAAVGRRARRD
jgi:agmatinase